MECREFREIISLSIDGEASPEEARRIHDHLEGCGECRAFERKMRAIGAGVARTEGAVPPDFREKLFARMEAEDLMPRRRSLFAFSIRWAAVPLAAAATLALFFVSSPDKGKDAVSTGEQLPAVARTGPAGETVQPGSSPSSAAPGSRLPDDTRRETASTARAGAELTPEERDIIAHLDILEDPSALDAPGDVDEMDIFEPPHRRQG